MEIGSGRSERLLGLSDYLLILRTYVWLILLTVLVALVFTAWFTSQQPRVYQSRATVLLTPNAGDGSGEVNPDTEEGLVLSTAVAERAKKAMGSPLPASELLAGVGVEASESNVIAITYGAADPALARQGAQAFAQAYLDFKRERAESVAAAGMQYIQEQIAELERQLALEMQIIDVSPPGSPERSAALARRVVLEGQIAALLSRLTPLEVAHVAPGEIITPAGVPASPVSPNLTLNLLLAVAGGAFAGVSLALLRERTTRRVRTPRELQEALEVPVLGAIPRARGRDWLRRKIAPRSVEDSAGPEAEAYRLLRTSFLTWADEHRVQIVMSVSAAGGEGKTTTACNLAAVLAHADKRVLLISADLRRPTAHEFFGLSNTTGLGDILAGEADPETAIRETSIDGLWLLPSGTPPGTPIADALSKGTGDLFQFCRERFDFIVLDCPPLLRVADTLELVPQGDGVLLVAEAERTRIDAIVQARAALEQANAPAVAAVLNGLRPGQGGYGYGYEAATSPPSSEGEPQRGVFAVVAVGVLALFVGLPILILSSREPAPRFSPPPP